MKGGLGEDGYVERARRRQRRAPATAACSTPCRRIATTGRGSTSTRTCKRNNLLLRYSSAAPTTARGTSRSWATTRSGTRRTRFRGARSRAARCRALGSIDTTLGGETSRYSLSGAWSADVGAGRVRAERLRDRLRPRPVLELHVLPRRPGRRRSVRAARRANDHGRRRRVSFSATSAHAAHVRRDAALRRHRRRRACSAPRDARTPVDRARATASRSSRSASTTRTRRAGPTGCARRSACAPIATTSTSRATSPENSGYAERLDASRRRPT